MARPRAGGDLGEALAADVFEHAVGDQSRKAGLARAQIHVEIAVVVEVGVVASHRGKDHVEAGFAGHVFETLSAPIVVELVGIEPMRPAQKAFDDIFERSVV